MADLGETIRWARLRDHIVAQLAVSVAHTQRDPLYPSAEKLIEMHRRYAAKIASGCYPGEGPAGEPAADPGLEKTSTRESVTLVLKAVAELLPLVPYSPEFRAARTKLRQAYEDAMGLPPGGSVLEKAEGGPT